MKKPLLLACLAPLLLPSLALGASQISPRDGLWLSLPPDSVKCVVLRLPMDAGLSVRGNYIFSVSVTPGARETWSDLSEQIVREVHENNTVLIPVCFDTAGDKPVGNCSAPYTITVSEEFTGTKKSWRGGTCVSEFPDADIRPGEEPQTGEEVREILNDNLDVFAAWLSEKEIYAKPGEQVSLNLSVQSSAEFDFLVIAQSQAELAPSQARLNTSQNDPLHVREFTLTAPATEGEYPVSFRVNPEDCQGESFCTRFLEAVLVVSREEPPAMDGFEVRLQPESIDIKEPGGVIMTLSIINHDDEEATFTSSMLSEPGDATFGFSGEAVEVGSYDSHTRVFIVTPGSSSRMYEIVARVESGGFNRSATSFITIDEMLADATRQAEGLGPESQARVTEWSDEHSDSEYGSDLQEYASLKEALDAAREEQEGNETGPPIDGNGNEGTDEPTDFLSLFLGTILPVILLAAAGLVAVVYLLKRSSGREQEEAEYY
jgi:hypothetical protein